MCQAFPGRFPSEVMEELGRLPVGWLEEIVEAGMFVGAHAVALRDDRASGGFIDVIRAFEFEDARAAAKAAKDAAAATARKKGRRTKS